MNLDIEASRGWVRDHDKDDPAFRTTEPLSDVTVDDREKARLTDDWAPRRGGEIDILVHHEEAQEWVDIAATAWLTWAQNANGVTKP